MPDYPDLFALAVGYHHAGHLAAAERAYRQFLVVDPRQADALHLLGVIAYQVGRKDMAVDLIGKAIAVKNTDAPYYANLSLALKDLGRVNEAVTACIAALLVRPDHTEAWSNLGVALKDLGRLSESIAACSAALQINSDYAEAHYNLGNALRESDRLTFAVESYRKALCLMPRLAEAQYNLGNALTELCRWREACVAYNAALRLKPNYPEAHGNLGSALQELGHLTEAAAAYRAALSLKPGHAKAHSNLGNNRKESGDLDAAVAAYGTALRIAPDFAEAHSNLAGALKDLGRLDHAVIACRRSLCLKPDCAEVYSTLGVVVVGLGQQDKAVAAFISALRIKPDYADAHHNLGIVLLLIGKWEEGWPEYEWRWRLKSFQSIKRDFGRPQWHGENLAGKTILLHAEQGIGDTLQFCRYAPLVAARGGRVILEVHRPLMLLLRGLPGVERLLGVGDPLPDFDCHCPLLSLPLAFGTRLDSIPASCPYIAAPQERVIAWRKRLHSDGLRIGIAWQGNPKYQDDGARSIPPDYLALLARLIPSSDIHFVSLQKEWRCSTLDLTMIDFMDEVVDFADTAAVIASLDLVISVDTAVAHLAGAMGKPVWLLNRFAPDWRWLLGRSDSPWYRTMRLFRQTKPGDWGELIGRVAKALETMLDGKDSA